MCANGLDAECKSPRHPSLWCQLLFYNVIVDQRSCFVLSPSLAFLWVSCCDTVALRKALWMCFPSRLLSASWPFCLLWSKDFVFNLIPIFFVESFRSQPRSTSVHNSLLPIAHCRLTPSHSLQCLPLHLSYQSLHGVIIRSSSESAIRHGCASIREF